jgi:DNA-binding HxlR family transcriptional regulator
MLKTINETPPRVEYSLTDNGLALLPVLKSMVEWTLAFEKKAGKKPK